MASVPRVEGHVLIYAHSSELRVMESARAFIRPEGAEERNPALVERRKERERGFDGGALRVRELGPGRLVVALDLRLVLRDGELEAHVAVEVAVGKVVDDLPDGPPGGSIGSLELVTVEPLD